MKTEKNINCEGSQIAENQAFIAEMMEFRAQVQNLEFKNRSRAALETGIGQLTGVNTSAKTEHGESLPVPVFTSILYLAPAKISGFEMCPGRTKECTGACLFTSGRAKIEIWAGLSNIQRARIRRTWLYIFNTQYFMDWVTAEITAARAKHQGPGAVYAVRLNGTSDISWEHVETQGFSNIFQVFPDVTFYDYTKMFKRQIADIQNYSLTFSYTGRNKSQSIRKLQEGENVAVVFLGKLPEYWNGFKVIDGDVSDYRPGDCKGVVVGLRFKAVANKQIMSTLQENIFVVDPEGPECQGVMREAA